MPRDYVHRTQTKTRKTRRSSREKQPRRLPWVSLLVVFLIIIFFFAGVIYIKDNPKWLGILQENIHRLLHNKSPASKKQTIPAISSNPTPSVSQPQFSFYTMLPRMSVDVDQVNDNASLNAGAPSTASAQYSRYFLQLVSLTDEDSAKAYQAMLKDKGFNTNITTVARGVQTIYRVQMGPFKDAVTAEAMQTKLQAQNVSSIVLHQTISNVSS